MATEEVEVVLANWIEQALSQCGQLPANVSASAWVAGRFSEWWRERAADSMADAEAAAASVRGELMRLGAWESFGEILDDLSLLDDAHRDLRALMRLSGRVS